MKSPRQAISLSKERQRSLFRALDRITALQREWNALSAAQRAAIAKDSCDRANFFRQWPSPRRQRIPLRNLPTFQRLLSASIISRSRKAPTGQLPAACNRTQPKRVRGRGP